MLMETIMREITSVILLFLASSCLFLYVLAVTSLVRNRMNELRKLREEEWDEALEMSLELELPED